ncbi:MAG: hypothetical protein JXR19_10555 [Bacteroidia bacterium]
MKTKSSYRHIILATLMVLSNHAFPQIEVNASPGDSIFQNFLKAKTTFIARNTDDTSALRRIFNEQWTLTPFKIVKYDRIVNSVVSDSVNYISIDYTSQVSETHGPASRTIDRSLWVHLDLWRLVGGEKEVIARTKLHLDDISENSILAIAQPNRNYFPSDTEPYRFSMKGVKNLYTKAEIHNWSPAFLALFLQTTEHHLRQAKKVGSKNEYVSDRLEDLKDGTLLVPTNALIRTHPIGFYEYGSKNPKKVFKSYPFKYNVINETELMDSIRNTTEPNFALYFVRTFGTTHYSIIDLTNGDIVYAISHKQSVNFGKSDINAIIEKLVE